MRKRLALCQTQSLQFNMWQSLVAGHDVFRPPNCIRQWSPVQNHRVKILLCTSVPGSVMPST